MRDYLLHLDLRSTSRVKPIGLSAGGDRGIMSWLALAIRRGLLRFRPGFAAASLILSSAVAFGQTRWESFPASVSTLPDAAALQAPPLVWPPRLGGQPKLEGLIEEIDAPLRLRGTYQRFTFSQREDVHHEGLLRLKQRAGLTTPLRYVLPAAGSWIYYVPERPAPGPDGKVRIKKSDRNPATMTLQFTSARVTGVDEEGKPEVVTLDKTMFYYLKPSSNTAERGVALIMPGLLGTPEGPMGKLTTLLRAQGWGVLRMLAQPATFVEPASFELDVGQPPEAQLQGIITLAGERTAECAYSVEAAFGYLETKFPQYASLPRVAVGFSGGALTLPTVISREPARYARAVLIGGGANFFLMTLETNYKNVTNVNYHWKSNQADAPAPGDLARWSQAYLSKSPLDSYFTAAVMKDKPTLVIMGEADYAVPSPLGDLLWERMGKPERIVVPDGSHELLFVVVPNYFDRVMEFIGGK